MVFARPVLKVRALFASSTLPCHPLRNESGHQRLRSYSKASPFKALSFPLESAFLVLESAKSTATLRVDRRPVTAPPLPAPMPAAAALRVQHSGMLLAIASAQRQGRAVDFPMG